MARRKESGLEVLASPPWPVCIVLGLIAYISIRYGVGWYLTSRNSPVLMGVGKAGRRRYLCAPPLDGIGHLLGWRPHFPHSSTKPLAVAGYADWARQLARHELAQV
jgi:hypothetical protein